GERLDAAQALGEREQPQRAQEAARLLEPALELEGDHAARTAHLALRELVLRVRREPRIVHALHARRALETTRELRGGLDVALHAQRQRLDAAQDEVAVHRTRHGADRVLQVA